MTEGFCDSSISKPLWMLVMGTIFLHLLPLLLPQLPASQRSCQSMVSHRCYMHFVYRLHSGSTSHSALQQAGTRTLPSGAEGAVWEEAALGERLKGRLIRQQEGWVQGGEGSQCRQALGFIHFHLVFFLFYLLLMLSLTNLQVPVHYTINVAMIYTF